MENIHNVWDKRARFYDLHVIPMELMGLGNLRKKAIQYVEGPEVLEVGVGTGRNLPLYPPGFHITGIDVSRGMLERAHRRTSGLGSRIDLREMDAQSLTFPDSTFDTVVATCVFCSVPDPVMGLMEIRRVCKPGGRVILLEHMRPEKIHWLGRLFDRLDPILYRGGGVHIARRTMDNIARAGLRTESTECHFSDIVRIILAHPAK